MRVCIYFGGFPHVNSLQEVRRHLAGIHRDARHPGDHHRHRRPGHQAASPLLPLQAIQPGSLRFTFLYKNIKSSAGLFKKKIIGMK